MMTGMTSSRNCLMIIVNILGKTPAITMTTFTGIGIAELVSGLLLETLKSK